MDIALLGASTVLRGSAGYRRIGSDWSIYSKHEQIFCNSYFYSGSPMAWRSESMKAAIFCILILSRLLEISATRRLSTPRLPRVYPAGEFHWNFTWGFDFLGLMSSKYWQCHILINTVLWKICYDYKSYSQRRENCFLSHFWPMFPFYALWRVNASPCLVEKV